MLMLLQVVKRAGNVPDGSRFDSLPSAGSKRSTRDGAGGNAESSLYETQSKTKRHRGDRSVWSSNGRDNNKQTNFCFTGFKRMPESKVNGLLRRIPPTRSADDLLQLNSSRKSYSTWTHNGLRCRSPDRILSASRGFSPPGNINDQQQVLTFRPIDSSRAAAYMGKDASNHSRPTGSIHFLTKATLPLEATKQVSRLPPPNSIAQKNSYLGVEPLTVASFLHSLGLGKYIILFQAEEVSTPVLAISECILVAFLVIDMTALKQMRDNDLKELGIPMIFESRHPNIDKEQSICHAEKEDRGDESWTRYNPVLLSPCHMRLLSNLECSSRSSVSVLMGTKEEDPPCSQSSFQTSVATSDLNLCPCVAQHSRFLYVKIKLFVSHSEDVALRFVVKSHILLGNVSSRSTFSKSRFPPLFPGSYVADITARI
ncbi:hypothetical protein CK203_076622 [Vitis vinifera]|uniref:SAM domain-containing protein n=1 Tax=Vitis vinifera TaxID=29760 RepID=A0A438EYI8_VITVI|nr:hypothetical protein CK203_076622 [Vitis vinifera]